MLGSLENTVPLASVVHGKGKGAPILLVHGANQRKRVWCSVAPILSHQHEVHAVDLRGHGDSLLGEGKPSMHDVAADLYRYMEDHGLSKPSVFGHSQGVCGVAELGRLLKQRGELGRVKGFGLLNPPSPIRTAKDAIEKRRDAQKYRDICERYGEDVTLGQVSEEAKLSSFVSAVAGKNIRENNPGMLFFLTKLSEPMRARTAQHGQERRATQGNYFENIQMLCQNGVSVGIITSQSDEATPPAIAHELRQQARGSVLATMPYDTHMTMLRAPKMCANVIDHFDHYFRTGSTLARNRL